MHFLVAIDDSECAHDAFQWALQTMNKDVDTLYLCCVAEKLVTGVGMMDPYAGYAYSQMLQFAEENKRATKRVLLKYYRAAKHAGAKLVTPLLGNSTHVGQCVCTAAEKREADFIVMGSRGRGKWTSMLLGSTSKYVSEHAKCNVMIIKTKLPATEQHVPIQSIDELEEAERQRRISEQAEQVTALEEKRRHELDLNIVRLAQEKERWRLCHEDHQISDEQKKIHQELLNKMKDLQVTDLPAHVKMLPEADKAAHLALAKTVANQALLREKDRVSTHHIEIFEPHGEEVVASNGASPSKKSGGSKKKKGSKRK